MYIQPLKSAFRATTIASFLALCLAVGPASAQSLDARISGRLEQVNRMLDAAAKTDANALLDAKTEIEEMPYPVRGDRRVARKLNTSALEKFKAEQVAPALAEFEKAWQSDPSDQEISNNYGYALYRSNRLADAESKLRYTLALAPGRATAWANLAEVFGAQALPQQASQAFVMSHRFSRNPDVTRQYIEKFAASTDVPGLKEGAELALKKLFPPAATTAGGAAPAQALAVTSSERKSMDAADLQVARTVTPVAAPVAAKEAPPADAVPVALRDPMAKLIQSLPASEVPRLYQAAATGSAPSREALLRMAHGGDLRAQNAVGNLYNYGYGIETNPELANTWYTRAANAGFGLAQFSLAYNQNKGIGTAVDYGAAAENYRRAAEQGHPYAMNNLAILHERGTGVDRDRKAAFAWYMRAAETGLARGAYNVGLYTEGTFASHAGLMAQDRKRATAFYRSAANVGFAQAELRMGQIHEYGLDGTVDKEQAIVWYKRAALQGLEPAKNALKQWGITDY
ncbi:MAG: tetratricopeptide repeat protein [Pseudomonadota bacterium]